jgi:predicted nucleic acid-binding protein
MIILDTSVALKWSVSEADTDIALRVLDALVAGQVQAAAPDLIFYEMGNAFRLKASFSIAAVQSSLSQVEAAGVEIVEPTPELLARAVTLARRYNTSVYDATYLALALERGWRFLTADARFVRATKGCGACVLLSDFEPD